MCYLIHCIEKEEKEVPNLVRFTSIMESEPNITCTAFTNHGKSTMHPRSKAPFPRK